jgi:tetratricopeptide (TPR) repeat protein
MPPPARIRRKDLRAPDEFATLTTRAAAWMAAHRRLVGATGGALLAAGVVALVVGRHLAVRNEAAAREFGVAHARFAAGQFADAATGFAALAETYPRAPFGRLARLYRGHSLAREGKMAAAVTAYEEFLRVAQGDVLRQEALALLGQAREAAGDRAGALDAYAEAGEMEGPYRADALLGAARLHESAGRHAEAQELYRRLDEDAGDPGLKALLQAKLAGTGPGSPTGVPTPGELPAANP